MITIFRMVREKKKSERLCLPITLAGTTGASIILSGRTFNLSTWTPSRAFCLHNNRLIWGISGLLRAIQPMKPKRLYQRIMKKPEFLARLPYTIQSKERTLETMDYFHDQAKQLKTLLEVELERGY